MEELRMIEKPTVEQAETEFLKLREEGCWQVVKAMKIVWSWKSFSYVARFTVKRVEKRYDLIDYMGDLNRINVAAMGALKSVIGMMEAKRRYEMELKLKMPVETKKD